MMMLLERRKRSFLKWKCTVSLVGLDTLCAINRRAHDQSAPIVVCWKDEKGKHVALHCRQGLGRAALMAASLLVLNGFSPDEAFDRLSKARGYQVPETEEQRAWVIALKDQL